MSPKSGSVYWTAVPPPKPIDAERRVVNDETGRPVTRASDPRVRWWEQRWTDPRGRSRRRRFEDKREAERLHEDLREAKRNGWPACERTGLPLSPREQRAREIAATMTFDDLIAAFLTDRRGEWAPKTTQTYEPALRLAQRWLTEAFDGTSPPAAAVSRRQLTEVIKRRRHTVLSAEAERPDRPHEHVDWSRTVVSAATVKNFKKALGFVFAYAIEHEIIEGPNPTRDIRLRNLPQRATGVTPTLDEVEALVERLAYPYDMVVLLRATTALRPQEVRGLRVRDVDTETWWLWVHTTETALSSRYHPEGLTVVEGGLKSRDDNEGRWVPVLHPWVQTWLRKRVSVATDPHDRVVLGPQGGPVNMNNLVSRHFNPAVVRLWAGTRLEGLTFYELRHTAHGVWRDLGVSTETAAQWAGHDLETMNRHYRLVQHGEATRAAKQAHERLQHREVARTVQGEQ